MTTPPASETLAAETQALALYLERRDWAAALAAWQQVESLVGVTIDSQLAIAHCRIELAAESALDGIVVQSPAAASRGQRDACADLIRARAFECLLGGQTARSAQLTRLLTAVDPHLRHVVSRSILPRAAPATGLPPLPAARPPLPFEEDLVPEAVATAALARHRHRRVLLVMRQFLTPGPQAVMADLVTYMEICLTRLGLPVARFESHPADAADRAAFADRLRAAIADFRPDVILVDDLLASGASADPAVAPAALAVLQAAHDAGIRLIGSYPDAWHPGVPARINQVAGLCDLFHLPHVGLASRLTPAAGGKVLHYPYPYVDPRPAATAEPPLPRACVVGRINWSNASRLVWWNEIAMAGLPVDFHPTIHGAERSAADYAALVARYAVTINFTTRTTGMRIMTGRSIESPLVGSVLLEEACDDTAWFLRPWEHYVPFSTLQELGDHLTALLADAPRRQAIAAAGQDWVRRHFTGAQFWAQALVRLYGQ